ncbi:MAG: hypothetical protein ABSE89_10390 [Sedimentisphaerales bacterium]
MKHNLRQLVLRKGSEKYIFRYQAGCEDSLLEALISQASDSRTSFDWFDAAVLSFKLVQSLISEADRLLKDPASEIAESFEI